MNQHFFIIGAQRCGTTFIADYLSKYDEINLIKPLKPEPKFFSKTLKQTIDIQTYLSLFHKYGKHKFYGEKSTDYIENINSLHSIKKLIPDAKILVILRNPINRCISNYKLSKESGLEKLSFDEAIRTDPKTRFYEGISSNPFNYLSRGIYINYLRQVYEVFENRNIHIFIFEELLDSEMSNLLNVFGLIPNKGKSNLDFEYNRSNIEFELNQENKEFLQKFYKKSVIELQEFLGRKIVKWSDFQI